MSGHEAIRHALDRLLAQDSWERPYYEAAVTELDALAARLALYEQALREIEPLLDAQFDGHETLEEYAEKVQKLNDALDIARAALAGERQR